LVGLLDGVRESAQSWKELLLDLNSLAFLAPNLVKAAIEGRLPHGMGVTRLADLPAEWSRQYHMLGLPAQ
jgi:hypothetical protein